MSSIISADLEPLMKIIGGCKNNSEKSSTIKVGEHIPCGYPMLQKISVIYTEVKIVLYEKVLRILKRVRSEDNFEKQKTIPLTNEHQESYGKAKIYYIC